MTTETLSDLAPLAYQQIRDRLLERLGREWQPGARLPPISQLALELDAGQRNTHRAVRSLVDDGFLTTRPGAGTYVRRGSAAVTPELPLTGRAVTIAMYDVPVETFKTQMCNAAAQWLTARGAKVTIRHLTIVEYRLRQWRDDAADAVLLMNPDRSASHERRPQQHLIIASTTQEISPNLYGDYDVATADEVQGSQLAGHAARAAGWTSACYVGVRSGPRSTVLSETSTQRLRGFERGWGAEVSRRHVYVERAFTEGAGARAVPWFLALRPRPQVVFTASDEIAAGFRLGAMALGLQIGKDFQLIGFDGQDRALHSHEGPLATVIVPAEEMGRSAAQLLVERFAAPDRPARRVLLNCRFAPGVTLQRNTKRPPAVLPTA